MFEISLVIPVKNEEKSIISLYNSIKNQSLQPNEIIIVDGGSTDKTIEIIEQLILNDSRIKLIKLKHAYPGTGRNEGVKNSNNNIIAFTDAGIILDKNWLSELIKPIINDKSVDVVFGLRLMKKNNLFLECADLVYGNPFKKVDGFLISPFIANSIMKKSVWETVGGFPDFRAGEDHIFMNKILDNKNFKAKYNPKAIVYWEFPSNFKSLFEHFSEYSFHDILSGRWKVWHYPLFRIYLIVLIIICVSIVWNVYLLFLIPLGIILRVYRKFYKNKAFKEMLDIKKVIISILILLVLDLSCFNGTFRYFLNYFKQKLIERLKN